MLLPAESLCSSASGFIQEPHRNSNPNSNPATAKRKRNLPGTPDPDAEVIALSPGSLMATNRFICEICNKGFQRDQNLQLHRRGHNLPWKLKQRNNKEVVRKKVYLCPVKTCVHHHPCRALGDLTGIKKHYSRKHGEKKWKCDKCCKKYAVQSDCKAHSKICGTREYKCDCGTLFSRKDSFITHRAFCDALAENGSRIQAPNTFNLRNHELMMNMNTLESMGRSPQFSAIFGFDQNSNLDGQKSSLPMCLDHNSNAFLASTSNGLHSDQLVQQTWNIDGLLKEEEEEEEEEDTYGNMSSMYNYNNNSLNHHHRDTWQAHMSATALLQKPATMESTRSNPLGMFANSFGLMNSTMSSSNQGELMLMGDHHTNINVSGAASDRLMMMIEDGQMQGHLMYNYNQMEGGMTRDFLGVGGNNNQNFINSTFLQQEKFGSMSPTMDLAQQYSCTTTTGSH